MNALVAMPGGWELVLIVLVILLLFGAKKLPELARGSGRALRIFKSETKGLIDDDDDDVDEHQKTPEQKAIEANNTPAESTPQYAVMDPTSIYGISKLAGERLCEYYHSKYGVDVRSIRYPGIISFKSPPGGGTTDYAIAIFHAALKGETYECFLGPETTLPMIYMPDAIRATIELMDAAPEQVAIRSSYNVAGVSFNPRELAAAIKKALPEFAIAYKPDSRQQIADSWPKSLDDSRAQGDWGWKARIGVEEMVADMLKNIDVGVSA